MTDTERRELQRLLASLLAEPDTPLEPERRRMANLLASSRPDGTARALRRLVAGQLALHKASTAAAQANPSAPAPAALPAAADPPLPQADPGRTAARQVATLAGGVAVGVLGGGLVLAGLDALSGDDADLPDLLG